MASDPLAASIDEVVQDFRVQAVVRCPFQDRLVVGLGYPSRENDLPDRLLIFVDR